MKRILPLALLLFAACSSPDESYCHKAGFKAGTEPYAGCIQNYSKDKAWASADYAVCLSQAKESVPDYLYPMAHYEEQNYVDSHGIYRTHNVIVEPDFAEVRGLNNERMAIVAPCMQQKGWNDAQAWQALLK